MYDKINYTIKGIMGNTSGFSIISLVLFVSIVCASGGYDHGTATGKGKLQLDLTWNPQNRIKYGQTYAVIGFGITDQLDLHGYLSHHKSGHDTWYAGVFYQFLDRRLFDLATAVGIRKYFDKNLTHLFFPQFLYTIHASENIYVGGSLVNLIKGMDFINGKSMGMAIDIAIFHKIQYQSKLIESIAVGLGGFHPASYKSDSFFLPTYSIDIKFNRLYKSK